MKSKKVMLFKIKYLGPTNFKGSRVVIESQDCRHRNNDKPKRKVLSYDHAFNSSGAIGENALIKAGFKVLGCNDFLKGNETIIFTTWEWSTLTKFYGIKGE